MGLPNYDKLETLKEPVGPNPFQLARELYPNSGLCGATNGFKPTRLTVPDGARPCGGMTLAEAMSVATHQAYQRDGDRNKKTEKQE